MQQAKFMLRQDWKQRPLLGIAWRTAEVDQHLITVIKL